MKHEYSSQQIEEASDLASNGYTRIGINFLLDFLNHLPEPVSDDWQECAFEDIRKGDRVRLEKDGGDFEEFTVGSVDKYSANAAKSNYCVSKSSTGTLYRIPAPVQHPDPAEHPVIIVRETIVGPLDEPTPMIHDGGNYYESPTGTYGIKTITDWTPGKVVEDDR